MWPLLPDTKIFLCFDFPTCKMKLFAKTRKKSVFRKNFALTLWPPVSEIWHIFQILIIDLYPNLGIAKILLKMLSPC